MSMPKVTMGMEALVRDNPWPELPVGVDPFYLSLDGGGRHLITDVIRDHSIDLMVEIGCFLCGSTRQWFESSSDVVIIGVDPWDGNWSKYVRAHAPGGTESRWKNAAEIADTIQQHGNYCLALNNIREFRDRFIPVRQRSPDALHYLHGRGIRPQLIYIDAFKTEDDLWVAHELFPDAILCGDDWDWTDEGGQYRMREHVKRFAREFGSDVVAEGATWVLSSEPDADRSWRPELVDRLMKEVDGDARSLLSFVATARPSATVEDAAQELGKSVEVLLRAMKSLNDSAVGINRPQVLELGGDPEGGWATVPQRPLRLAVGAKPRRGRRVSVRGMMAR